MNVFVDKFKEVIMSVLPVTAIVLLLNFTIAPIGTELIGRFIVGAIFIVFGLSIFLFGAELGIQPIGTLMGAAIAKKKKLWVVVVFGFLLGFLVNIAEPDLLVLARQVSDVTSGAIGQTTLLIVVSIGIGVMVAIGLARIVFKVPLNRLLTVLYGIIFALVLFAPKVFLGIAFDSGGATTGSMTVPFVLALGLGLASIQGGKESEEDSFGLVGIASTGPMLAVLTMSLLSGIKELSGSLPYHGESSGSIILPFLHEIPVLLVEVTFALLPFLVLFLIFQVLFIKLPKKQFTRILKGLLYTYIGFLLFLTGVNAGFMEAGSAIGHALATLDYNWIVIPIGFILGFVVIYAEPAVYVLNEQIETVTSGHIQRKLILYALSIGVASAVALSMIKILVPGIQLWHLLVPGYLIAVALSYFAPNLFVGIAFDSGGVASGPMTATFILAFAQGVAEATPGADVLLDAFGVIAMVALTPLIAIQILGLIYKHKAKQSAVGEE